MERPLINKLLVLFIVSATQTLRKFYFMFCKPSKIATLIIFLCCPYFMGKSIAQPVNVQKVPTKILQTGTDLKVDTISPNAVQLANELGLMPTLIKLQDARTRLSSSENSSSNNPALRLEVLELKQSALESIQKNRLDIDFVQAAIMDEQNITNELLNTIMMKVNKKVVRINAISFITNGILWAIAEGLDIPTYKYPKYSIPSGTTGILAGIIPSIASIYALKAVEGGHYSAPAEPNMLAKLFARPVQLGNTYPESVWGFLNTAPASENNSKTRREQIIDRWIADANIPKFTDKSTKKQIDLVTNTVPQNRTLTIEILHQRQIMLQQLGGEVMKMNRLLLELMMVITGEKQIISDN